jgi:hypothetical protein
MRPEGNSLEETIMAPNISIALLAVLAAHFTADFCLQGDVSVTAKRQFQWLAYLKHSFWQTILVSIVIGNFSVCWLAIIILAAVVGATHPLIDLLKEAALRFAPKVDDKPSVYWEFWSVILDQLLHVTVLIATIDILGRYSEISAMPHWNFSIDGILWRKILVAWIAMVLVVYAGGVLVRILVQPMLQEIQKPNHQNTIAVEGRGLQNGGKRIGQLERALILLFVLSSQPAGVGFLVTAKSIFRFGELKDNTSRMEAEYIIIGTMLSFTWGLGVALATLWVLQAL